MRRRITFALLLIPLGLAGVWLLGSDATRRAVGSLEPEQRGEVTILFFGDSGAGSALQYRVARSMGRVCERLGCDFGLMLGDNVYAGGQPLSGGDDPRLDEMFGKPFAPLRSIPGFRLYAVMGNHDQLAGIDAERAYAAGDPLWEIPGLSFPVPGLPDWLHIFGLFTPPIFELEEADPPGDPQGDWLPHLEKAEAYLCDPRRVGWKILFGHHPIHSSAHGTAKRMRARLLPVIRRCGVRFYLAGHAHQQEHISTDDFEQLIQGASSSPREAAGWFKTGPKSSFLSEQPGFGIMRASRERVALSFFDVDGVAIYSWSATR